MILSPIEFQRALQKLQNLSLVEHRSHNGTSSLWIHDLIHLLTREGAKKEEAYHEWLQSSWSFVYRMFTLVEDPSLPRWWADCEKFMPHLQSLKHVWCDVHGTNLEVIRVNSQIAKYLSSRGRYDEAETMYKEVLEASEKQLGTDHPDTLTAMNNLARAYASQGRYDDAESLHKQALDGREKRLGAAHPDKLRSMNDLALVYSSRGRHDGAEEQLKQALQGRAGYQSPRQVNGPRSFAMVGGQHCLPSCIIA
jgi:tetratricopeptide (TPR) repeat protein